MASYVLNINSKQYIVDSETLKLVEIQRVDVPLRDEAVLQREAFRILKIEGKL
jgi:hypothetical protein